MEQLISKYFERALFFVIVLLVIYVRMRYANMAMERDEGEYAYAASQILRSGFPFKDFYNMKLPGVYYAYSGLMLLLGKSIFSIRIGVMFLNLASSVMVLKLGQRWINERAGYLAAAFFLLLSLHFAVQGIVSNCEHFVVFCLLVCLYLFANERYFWAGLFAAFTVFMKQQGAILLVFAFVFFVYQLFLKRKEGFIFKKIGLAALGFSIPFVVFLSTVLYKGVWESFHFFVIDYSRAYIGIEEPHHDFRVLTSVMRDGKISWFCLKIILIFALIIGIFYKKKAFKSSLNAWFLILFVLVSYLSILPGWYYRPHYYQYLMPSVALLMAYSWAFLSHVLAQTKYKMLFALLLFICVTENIYDQRQYFFEYSTSDFLNKMYPDEHFGELRTLGTMLKSKMSPTDSLGMIGNEPQLLFYTDKVSASGYLYCYPFIEKQMYNAQMATQFKTEITTCKPKWIVDCMDWEKWPSLAAQTPLNETKQFVQTHYILRGVLLKNLQIAWPIDSIPSKNTVKALVYERKD